MATKGASRVLKTIAQAMEQLQCSRRTIYNLATEGKLELVRIAGHQTRVTERSLDALVDEMLNTPIKQPPTERPDNGEGKT